MPMLRRFALAALFPLLAHADAPSTQPFDGSPWNVSTGNASVIFIQHSPVGAFPSPNFKEAPPADADLKRMHAKGLTVMEDYVAWGALEREPGKWDFSQHDAMEKAMHAAGMKYVVFPWVHFPPTWLRYTPDCTLLRCNDHNEAANYLSVFDPRSLQWYDHFYKAMHDHFGDRIDSMYAGALGPYGEGNYPLEVRDWVAMGHCHETYWAADPYAVKSFIAAMKAKYADVAALNAAWGTALASLDDVRPPHELATEKFKPSPALFPTPQDKTRWLDFIKWYHSSLVNFCVDSAKLLTKYYPADRVRLKPGGTAGGINPVAWGTYSPEFAKAAGGLGITLQPADSGGAIFADKWLGTAYHFYNVRLSTEPATALNDAAFHRRLFSDVSVGARQFFTYEFEAHAADVAKYVHLYTGQPGDTEIAVYCPTTLWRLGADVWPTIRACNSLRELCEFDVLDELLIGDGALTTPKYKTLVVFQADLVERPILDKIDAFLKAGGRVVRIGSNPVVDVQGKPWTPTAVTQIPASPSNIVWVTALSKEIAGQKGVEPNFDRLYVCRRGKQAILFNPTGKPQSRTENGSPITLQPHELREINE